MTQNHQQSVASLMIRKASRYNPLVGMLARSWLAALVGLVLGSGLAVHL